MDFKKFLSYGLRCGDLVEVTLSNRHFKPECRNLKVELFFRGFRNLYLKPVVSSAEDIVPVFCEKTKHGKMGRKHYTSWYTWLDNIKNVKVIKKAD